MQNGSGRCSLKSPSRCCCLCRSGQSKQAHARGYALLNGRPGPAVPRPRARRGRCSIPRRGYALIKLARAGPAVVGVDKPGAGIKLPSIMVWAKHMRGQNRDIMIAPPAIIIIQAFGEPIGADALPGAHAYEAQPAPAPALEELLALGNGFDQ